MSNIILIIVVLYAFFSLRALHLITLNFTALDVCDKLASKYIEEERYTEWKKWFNMYDNEKIQPNMRFIFVLLNLTIWNVDQIFKQLYTTAREEGHE